MMARLNHLGSRTDAHALHLLRLFGTAAGTDKVLQVINYAAQLVHPQIRRIRSLQNRHAIQSFVDKAQSVLLPGETLIARIDLTDNGSLARWEAGTKSLATLVTDFRMFVRSWGLLGMYAWGRGLYLDPPSDAVIKAISWGQVSSMVMFQVYENLAYLAGKGVLRGQWCNPAKQAQWWLTSCRFWLAYTLLEFLRLLRVWQTGPSNSDVEGVEGKEVDPEIMRKRSQDETSAWRRAWYVNAVWTPFVLHYCFEDGLLNSEALSVCGFVTGIIGIKQMWKATS